MTGQHWVVNSTTTRDDFINHVTELFNKHHYVTFTWDVAKQRTKRQNNALHVWLGQVANLLNESGMDMKKTLKAETDIPWTMQSAKDHLWRPIQKTLVDKESRADCETTDYNKVYEILSRHFSQKFGITLPEWPKND